MKILVSDFTTTRSFFNFWWSLQCTLVIWNEKISRMGLLVFSLNSLYLPLYDVAMIPLVGQKFNELYGLYWWTKRALGLY